MQHSLTAASEAEAENLAKSRVEHKLAACVSLSPIRSIYTWQGEIQAESYHVRSITLIPVGAREPIIFAPNGQSHKPAPANVLWAIGRT